MATTIIEDSFKKRENRHYPQMTQMNTDAKPQILTEGSMQAEGFARFPGFRFFTRCSSASSVDNPPFLVNPRFQGIEIPGRGPHIPWVGGTGTQQREGAS
ncbi:MAG TPA: hypothetical protein VJ985_09495 [Gammaproteobacteria bacterium]|nr:hypothetical protein [Gammaproteobacteria bacterium]